MILKLLKNGQKIIIDEVQRFRIVVLPQEGYAQRQISLAEHCSKTTAHNASTKFKNSGCYADSKRSRRSRNSAVRDDLLQYVLLCGLRKFHPKKMRSALLQKNTAVSIKNVKRGSTKAFGLEYFKPAKKPCLIHAIKLRRLQFAQQQVNWTSDQ